jgi:hypothetical protein
VISKAFYMIYPSAKISYWNQLMTGTRGFWKRNQEN